MGIGRFHHEGNPASAPGNHEKSRNTAGAEPDFARVGLVGAIGGRE